MRGAIVGQRQRGGLRSASDSTHPPGFHSHSFVSRSMRLGACWVRPVRALQSRRDLRRRACREMMALLHHGPRFEVAVLEYAAMYGIRAVAVRFGLDRKTVRAWRARLMHG